MQWDEVLTEGDSEYNEDGERLGFDGKPIESDPTPVVGMPELGYEPDDDED